MWCQHCRQDTPGIRSAAAPGIRCGRCGAPLVPATDATPHGRQHPAETGLDLTTPPAASGVPFEDWDLDQTLRSLEARVGAAPRRERAANEASREPYWRVDGAHLTPPPPHEKPKRRAQPVARRGNTFARSMLWLGLLGLIGGAALFGYGAVEEHFELVALGLPTAGSGAICFLLGLVLQLERIWSNSRMAVSKLKHIDAQLAQLERTTTMLGVTQGSASQAFYSHLAESASPHLLLADLKGQIDLLALSMARRGA